MNELEDEYGELQCELTKIRIKKEKIDLKTAKCIHKIYQHTLELEKSKDGK